MTPVLFEFIIFPSCERALKNGSVNSKIVRKLSSPNPNKAVLVKVFLRFEILIFNSNFLFCMMSSFSSMTRVAS